MLDAGRKAEKSRVALVFPGATATRAHCRLQGGNNCSGAFAELFMAMNFAPPPTFDSLNDAITSLFGASARVTKKERVSGGDINQAFALSLSDGGRVFMKANARTGAEFFLAEAAGLSAIASTGAIGTPKVFCAGTDGEAGSGFLLMEWIQSASPKPDYWERLAERLAAMHAADCSSMAAGFGFFSDNFIGSRPQSNAPSPSWISFFRENRLLPQFKAADAYFSQKDRALITRLLDRLDEFLTEPKRPSLVHGDLWSGNVLCGADGQALLIDPAAYVGHAEADIAMTELFGGFPRRFYEAYKNARGVESGYAERWDIYNLYQLLNHLNLFGPGYLGSVMGIVARYAG